jgi:glycosyltransferase involved in cell wall biosynthesis
VLAATPRAIVQTLHTLRAIQPNIIHVQYAIPVFRFYSLILWWILLVFRQSSRVKIVVTVHEVQRELAVMGYVGRLYYYIISRLFDQIYVLTDTTRVILSQQCGIPATKLFKTPHGTYEFRHTTDRRDLVIDQYNLHHKRVILFFGYIHVDKGLQYLLKALHELYARHPAYRSDVICVVAGAVRPRVGMFKVFELLDRRYEMRLHRLKRALGLDDSVRFVGFVDDQHIYSLFQCATIAVLPYTKVEQSGVLHVALAAQRPIVATAIGGFVESLHQSGVLVPPRDTAALATALARLLDDPQAREQLRQQYRHIQETQSAAHIARLLEKEYDNLLATNQLTI